MIIIILGQQKDNFEKKVFKTIYNLQSFFETVNLNICRFKWIGNIFKHNICSSIFQSENTKRQP